jgi:GT2 family glycosyltransferase/glycosyltransferase involved in cell wall biosynthesis
MAIVAYQVLLPPIRVAACAMLFNVLRLSRHLDRPWPALGPRFRLMVLMFWWSVAMRLGHRLRALLRGESKARRNDPPVPHTNIAPEILHLPGSESPVVSVIIPTYGQLAFTLRCLASIQANPPATPIEIIVVDDAFPGPEAAPLRQVLGIRLLRNEVNLGFIRTCNAAARAAVGDYLLFLNNDTLVRPGWLDHMVALFVARRDAGIVGSKLIGEDGGLREAGGILWKDGSAWNYGLGGDPDAPEFNYVREVDYCSGASLMVRRRVFLGAGGFDEKYAPAYCEDSDLSFRLRGLGMKTYYQPRSVVVHHEGASHGRDIRHGVKSCQVSNQAAFLETWHDVLARGHFLNGTHVLRARDRAFDRRIVLIVDHYVPQPDRDAGSRTMIAFIRALLAAGFVVKFWPMNMDRTPDYTDVLQDLGVEVRYGPGHAALPDWLRANGADLDIVLLSRPDVAEICLPLVRSFTAARIAYYGHDLHFRRLADEAERTGDASRRRAAEAMRVREIGIWRDADVVLYPSEEEAAVARPLAAPVAVRPVIPYAFAASRDHAVRVVPNVSWILFVAGFAHPPNADAAVWFTREVLPLVVARVPAARLAIVGSHPSAEVAALRCPNVTIFANVSDAELLAWYQRARVAAVPLLSGAGVKLKTVEALWHGVPAVVTPVGAQGLPGVEDVVSIETEPAAFAAAVSALLTDDALWRRRGAAASGYARDRFSESAQRRSLLRALDIDVPPSPVHAGCATASAMA